MKVLEDLIQDDNAETRLNVIRNLNQVAKCVGGEAFSQSHICQKLKKMVQDDPQWRVKMAVVELVGDLCEIVDKQSYLGSMMPIFICYLKSTAAAVRQMGVKKLEKLAKIFKKDWVQNYLLPILTETYKQDKIAFHYRMACLESVAAVLPVYEQKEMA